MKTKTYGYIRVSTREQNENRQRDAMKKFGVPDDCLYVDKASGKNFDRPAWQQLMQKINPFDLLVVKSIDRLGRNYEEIIETWRILTKERNIYIAVLDMPLLDTRPARDLINTFIADLVLQILSYFAQTERENIRQRQAEGIHAAKMRGIKFGRPAKEPPQNFQKLYSEWSAGIISATCAAKELGTTRRTFRKWAQKYQTGQ